MRLSVERSELCCHERIHHRYGPCYLDDVIVREAWQERTAMNRIDYPEDLVDVGAFLASDDAAFVTGQSLNVDGDIVLS